MKLLSREDLVKKLLKSKQFRDAYVYEHVRNGIPFQTRALRTAPERNWTQADLGVAAKKPRNVITRLENPNYGKLTLKTLFEIASAFDVALLIKFVPFSRLLKEYEDVSSEALNAKSITDEEEIGALETWAAEEELESIAAPRATPLRLIPGRGNLTPMQPMFTAMYHVPNLQSAPPAESVFGKPTRPQHGKPVEDVKAEDEPLTLSKAAGGNVTG